MLKIVAYQADYGACYGYRLFFPLNTLATREPDDFKVKITHLMHPNDIESANAIILQRQVDGRSFANALTGRRNRGVRVIYEADDDFFNLPDWNPHRDFFQNPDIRQNFTYFLQECDAIFVSTAHLGRVYGNLNKHVYVLPNSVLPRHIPQRPSNNRIPVVGWTGSGTHKLDFERVQPALEELRVAGKAFIKLFQYPEATAYQVRWVQWVDYYVALALCDFDVGVAPLKDHIFNRSKSPIKHFEYAMTGTPTIASAVGPYAEAIEHEKTGILIQDDREWAPQILRLLEDRELAARLAENAREDVLARFNIETNYKLWRDALLEVCRRPARQTKRQFTLQKSEVSMNLPHAGSQVPMRSAGV